MNADEKLKAAQDAVKIAEKQMLDVLLDYEPCQDMTVEAIKQISITAGRLAFDATEAFRLHM